MMIIINFNLTCLYLFQENYDVKQIPKSEGCFVLFSVFCVWKRCRLSGKREILDIVLIFFPRLSDKQG